MISGWYPSVYSYLYKLVSPLPESMVRCESQVVPLGLISVIISSGNKKGEGDPLVDRTPSSLWGLGIPSCFLAPWERVREYRTVVLVGDWS